MHLSKNFTLSELCYSRTAVANKIDNIPDYSETINLLRLCSNILQPLRDWLRKPITVTSGFRCEELNSHPAVGGVPTSNHLLGLAADITWPGFWQDCEVVKTYLKTLKCCNEIIIYKGRNFLHVSLLPDY